MNCKGKASYSKKGGHKLQLCEHLVFREGIFKLCHEEFRVEFHALFLPIYYQEIEEFVRTCDICQNPKKIVPVILEVYSRLNTDSVGLLIPSLRENKYLITPICVASKYTEAILSQNLSCKHVVQA